MMPSCCALLTSPSLCCVLWDEGEGGEGELFPVFYTLLKRGNRFQLPLLKTYSIRLLEEKF